MPARSICGREAWAAEDWQGWGAGSAAQAACWAQSAASATDLEQTAASARDCCEWVAHLRAECAQCRCAPSSPELGAVAPCTSLSVTHLSLPELAIFIDGKGLPGTMLLLLSERCFLLQEQSLSLNMLTLLAY